MLRNQNSAEDERERYTKPAHHFKATKKREPLKELVDLGPKDTDEEQKAKDKKAFNAATARFGNKQLKLAERIGQYILKKYELL